jgi:hypothetical protein
MATELSAIVKGHRVPERRGNRLKEPEGDLIDLLDGLILREACQQELRSLIDMGDDGTPAWLAPITVSLSQWPISCFKSAMAGRCSMPTRPGIVHHASPGCLYGVVAAYVPAGDSVGRLLEP